MPHRILSQPSFFEPEFADPRCLRKGTVAWMLARHGALLFPSWLFAGWAGEGGRGRHAWPASVLMAMLLLRWDEEGMSRRASVRQAKRNTEWRAAMGLAIGGPTPSDRTIRRFESFLRQRHPDVGSPRYLVVHEHLVRLFPPPPVVLKDGRLGRQHIELDFEAGTARCANGVLAKSRSLVWVKEHGVRVPVFKWSQESCGSCPKRAACRDNQADGHRVVLHPYEQQLRAAREAWHDPDVRQQYRTRSQCERLVHPMTRHGGRKARAWGRGAAQLQAHLIAMRCNLAVLAQHLADVDALAEAA